MTTTGTNPTVPAPAPTTGTSPDRAPVTAVAAGRPDLRPVPFRRTTRVELRKMVDTRAGRWLLAIVTAAGLATIAATLIWSSGPHGLTDFLGYAAFPLSLLLPVIGIMGATAEWTQRTGLVTFTLEPRRGRVVAAKLVAAVLLGLAVLAAAVAASALATMATGSAWDLTLPMLAGLAAGLLLFVLQGVAFGFAFLNTPAAIVASLLLPTVWTIVGGLVPSVQRASEWLNLTVTTGPLLNGTMAGDDWAKLAASAALWIGLPLAVGTWRVLTREVK
ncbi:ABC transporter permease [Nakamurella sp.]|uniref:ABC transporter permease n=1 Tax=Nakamurella sp. TaxID=1869182 RepID=UPI003B3AAA9E